jgi:hypothetical protein
MELEKQVCSLELAKRLKELGVKQEAQFYWFHDVNGFWQLDYTGGHSTPDDIAAFTVAELGEMLKWTKYHSVFGLWMGKEEWAVGHQDPDAEQFIAAVHADTEADARAKMLIYLIENKLITL